MTPPSATTGETLWSLGYNFDRAKRMHLPDFELVEQAIAEADLPAESVLKRINYFRDGILYFDTNSVRQKNVLGIDWTSESSSFQAMNLITGDPAVLNQPESILISEAVADELKCRSGDALTLRVNTITGQQNTGTFVVRGIFRDTSLFGYYKCFIGRSEMNRLLGYKPGEVSSYGIVLKEGRAAEDYTERLYQALDARLPMVPPIRVKEDLTRQLDHTGWDGVRYFLVPLSVYVSQVDELLLAMDLMSYFLYIVMALIILVSISITYRVILRERTRELGTMRSMGLQRGGIVSLLLLEALWLFLSSLGAGALLAALMIRILTLFTYSWIPGFELFLRGGRLVPSFSITTITANILLLLVITLPAVLLPSLRSSRMELTRALTGNNR